MLFSVPFRHSNAFELIECVLRGKMHYPGWRLGEVCIIHFILVCFKAAMAILKSLYISLKNASIQIHEMIVRQQKAESWAKVAWSTCIGGRFQGNIAYFYSPGMPRLGGAGASEVRRSLGEKIWKQKDPRFAAQTWYS